MKTMLLHVGHTKYNYCIVFKMSKIEDKHLVNISLHILSVQRTIQIQKNQTRAVKIKDENKCRGTLKVNTEEEEEGEGHLTE